MFEIPELDRLIASQLLPHDLVQCAQVNKRWHRVVIPYIWHTLHPLSEDRKYYFRKLVLEDYLQRHWQQQQQQQQQLLHSTSPSTLFLSSFPTLTKFGPLVRHIPYPINLFEYLESPSSSSKIAIFQPHEPSAAKLCFHFLKRCTNLQSLFLPTTDSIPTEMWTISDRVTPRLEEIWFEHYDPPHCNTGSSDLLLLHDILYRSYVNLKRLVIKRFPLSKAMHSSLAHDEESKQPLLGLKDLELDECEDLQEWGLPLLLQRCIALERLTLKLSDLNVIPSLITGLKATDMSNLNEIHIKAEAAWGISSFLSDIQFADIISVSQVGWKVVNIDYWLQFESLSCEALLKHSKTLEVLHMTWWESLSTSKYLLQILSSCHKLHTFSTLERHKDDSRLITYLEANEFIQSDDRSDDTIIPWPCESSLKIFKARIIDIPRPDLVVFVNGRPIPFGLNETYAGEGRYLQQQVYRRLATFVHLEELCLGGTFHEDRPFFQYNCLEMTLESGLGLLEGLKELRKLEITYMQQCIGVKDVQWMVQHWPKLRVVKGLYDQDDNLEAATWLKDHYPGIEVEVFHKKKIIFDNDL